MRHRLLRKRKVANKYLCQELVKTIVGCNTLLQCTMHCDLVLTFGADNSLVDTELVCRSYYCGPPISDTACISVSSRSGGGVLINVKILFAMSCTAGAGIPVLYSSVN